jgi:hypothetical protein
MVNVREGHRLAVMVVVLLVGVCAGVSAEPVWYPPDEPSPFVPDDAQRVLSGPAKSSHYRAEWSIRGPVKKAVLMAAPMMLARVYLGGRLLIEAYDSHQALPQWVDVTAMLKPGPVLVAARVYSDWSPVFYAQMRVEYVDGTWEDLVTGPGWVWCDAPDADWNTNPQAGGDWRPVTDGGGYDAGMWQYRFALLPRELLRERMEPHNRHLRETWEEQRQEPRLALTEAPEREGWARQFADFARVDADSGQLLDGSGQVRHLFFTIYTQRGTLALEGMDLEQLERDLDLMAKGDVHPYMRNLGWYWLLDQNGDWAKLKQQPKGAGALHFERGIDLLDHLVRRAWAHGRYIVFEGDFFWSAHTLVPAPYRSRYHLYPEVLEAQALATRKIIQRYSDCHNVLGMMIGEEDIALDHDLKNPHQRALFQDYLQRKYGTVEQFRRETPWGYDTADRSEYVEGTWGAERWPGSPAQEVLVPRYTPRKDPFAGVTDFSQIGLPEWPWPRSVEAPEVPAAGCASHNQFSPEDPLWIDFYEMREDELLFGMLDRWAKTVRQGMPRQLLFYSNAQDFTSSWHFLHLYKRAELPFDVIGVGCHDADQNLSQLPAWATVRKAVKVVSSYRPYALAPGSPAVGIASGEGQGGLGNQPEEVLRYYQGALFDEVGGGVAWTQTYAWDHVSGAVDGAAPHETPLLKWMGEFVPAVQGAAFPLRRPVEVLVVRNTNLAHSNMSGLDYGNAMGVAEALSQLNVEFDVVMDRDLVYQPSLAESRYKVDLAAYRLVILPTVAIDLADGAWRALDAWVRGQSAGGPRALVVGWVGKRGPRLQPTDSFHPVLRDWLGCADYAATEALQGKQAVALEGAAEPLSVDFGRVPPVGVPGVGRPMLVSPSGQAIGVAVPHGATTVYAFGFPLGFAHEPLWGMAPEQSPRDAVAPLWEALVSAAGVDRPVQAPHNLRVYVAEGGTMVLVRERAGLATDADLGLRVPPGVEFPDLALTRGDDGYAHCRVSLKPWESRWFRAAAPVD